MTSTVSERQSGALRWKDEVFGYSPFTTKESRGKSRMRGWTSRSFAFLASLALHNARLYEDQSWRLRNAAAWRRNFGRRRLRRSAQTRRRAIFWPG